jgi:hypothetical protein
LKYKVYASVYKMPETGTVKMHSIVVVDSKGRLVRDAPGPANIAPLVGRFTQKLAKRAVTEWVKDNMDIAVKIEDVVEASEDSEQDAVQARE